jgi:hypothetical protein
MAFFPRRLFFFKPGVAPTHRQCAESYPAKAGNGKSAAAPNPTILSIDK